MPRCVPHDTNSGYSRVERERKPVSTGPRQGRQRQRDHAMSRFRSYSQNPQELKVESRSVASNEVVSNECAERLGSQARDDANGELPLLYLRAHLDGLRECGCPVVFGA